MHNSGTNDSCEITIRWNGMNNKIDRLSDLLREFAQEESLSVHLTVHRATQVMIRCKDKIYRCSVKALRYVTSDGHYCVCHLTDGDVRLRISFRNLMDQLQATVPGEYLLINRGMLVHVPHIREHTYDSVILEDGTVLPLRQRARAEMLADLSARQIPHATMTDAVSSPPIEGTAPA